MIGRDEIEVENKFDPLTVLGKSWVISLVLFILFFILFFTKINIQAVAVLIVIVLHQLACQAVLYLDRNTDFVKRPLFISTVLHTIFISIAIFFSGGFFSPLVVLYLFWIFYVAVNYQIRDVVRSATLAIVLYTASSLLSNVFFGKKSYEMLAAFVLAIFSIIAFASLAVVLKKYIDQAKSLSIAKEETYEKKLSELAYFNDLLARLSSIQDLEELLKAAGNEIRELIGPSSVLIFVREDNKEKYHCKQAIGKNANSFKNFSVNASQELVFDEISSLKKPIILDQRQLKVLMPAVSKKLKLHNALIIPLLKAGEVSGAVCCINKTEHFNEEDLGLLEMSSHQISILLENAHLFERMKVKTIDLEKQEKLLKRGRKALTNILEDVNKANNDLARALMQTQTMYRIAVELSKSLNETKLLNIVLHNSADLAQANGGSLILNNGSRLNQAANFNYSSDLHLSLLHTPIKWVVARKKPLLINDFRKTQYREYQRLTGIKSFIGVPLIQSDRCLGALCLFDKEGGFTEDDEHNLVTLAHQATVTILNARVLENEKRTISKLKEVDKMKADFVASVSHELRSPLTTIKGYLDLIIEGDAGEVNDEQNEYLHIIDQSSGRLLNLINDLLTISKIESDSLKINKQSLSINDVMERVAKVMQPEVKNKGLKLQVNLSRNLPFIQGDPDRLDQVIINLISNAIKFTPKDGSIELTTLLRGSSLQVSVRDTGIGIGSADTKKLFDKFFRSQEAITKHIKGTGLGLAIAKGIVEQHKGKIWVESKPEEGSTFLFTLPIKNKSAA